MKEVDRDKSKKIWWRVW